MMGPRLYTVHAPPGEAAPERVRFVKDGFSWPAFLFGPLWIIWRRLWLALVWYVAWMLAIAWVGRLAGEQAATILATLGAILFAFEANSIRRHSLTQKGWREVGGSYGRTLEEAEIRFFGASDAAEPEPLDQRRRPFWPNDDAPPSFGDERVLGLFPEPEPPAAR